MSVHFFVKYFYQVIMTVNFGILMAVVFVLYYVGWLSMVVKLCALIVFVGIVMGLRWIY
jgi:hypothetical protein